MVPSGAQPALAVAKARASPFTVVRVVVYPHAEAELPAVVERVHVRQHQAQLVCMGPRASFNMISAAVALPQVQSARPSTTCRLRFETLLVPALPAELYRSVRCPWSKQRPCFSSRLLQLHRLPYLARGGTAWRSGPRTVQGLAGTTPPASAFASGRSPALRKDGAHQQNDSVYFQCMPAEVCKDVRNASTAGDSSPGCVTVRTGQGSPVRRCRYCSCCLCSCVRAESARLSAVPL